MFFSFRKSGNEIICLNLLMGNNAVIVFFFNDENSLFICICYEKGLLNNHKEGK